MMNRAFLLIPFFVMVSLAGCQTAQDKGREAKADQLLSQDKSAPSGTKVKQTLSEPQTGFNQQPGDALSS